MSEQRNILIEVGTEEIPARMMQEAIEAYENRARQWCESNRVDGRFDVYGTPRRILFDGTVASVQSSWTESEKGPPVEVAFEDGEPTRALLGFCREHGISPDDVERRNENGGNYVFVEVERGGATVETIIENSFPDLLTDYTWPKSMRWEETGMEFVRPIRWLLAFSDDQPLEMTIGPIESGTRSRGLRFSENSRVRIHGCQDYAETITEDAGIEFDQVARRSTIEESARRMAADVKGEPVYDRGLLNEVTYLVESPVPFRGSFDEKFLEVPDEVLVETMQSHQKYFPIRGDEELLPYFVGVRNGRKENLDIVKEGNERVLRARLSDAKFFYENDLETDYEDYRDDLKGVVFQEKLGSLYHKTVRMADLIETLEGIPENLDHVARHCKNDLVTNMVEEFPELQGTMGKIYAGESGWRTSDAEIIEAHHRPSDRNEDIPEDPSAQILALVDRLDTLVGFFALGERPSGSTDPYGLRRDALGVIRLLLDGSLPDALNNLEHLLRMVRQGYEGEDLQVSDRQQTDLKDFFRERLVNYAETVEGSFEGAGNTSFSHQVLEASVSKFWNRPTVVEERYRWLNQWGRTNPKKILSILEAYRRIDNIVSAESVSEGEVHSEFFEKDVEKHLLSEVRELDEMLEDALNEGNPDPVFCGLESVVTTINDFFETVLVNTEDEAVKNNRLRLLDQVRLTFNRVADFSRISPKETPNI